MFTLKAQTYSETLDASVQRWPVSELVTPRTSCYRHVTSVLVGQRCTLASSVAEYVYGLSVNERSKNYSSYLQHIIFIFLSEPDQHQYIEHQQAYDRCENRVILRKIGVGKHVCEVDLVHGDVE